MILTFSRSLTSRTKIKRHCLLLVADWINPPCAHKHLQLHIATSLQTQQHRTLSVWNLRLCCHISSVHSPLIVSLLVFSFHLLPKCTSSRHPTMEEDFSGCGEELCRLLCSDGYWNTDDLHCVCSLNLSHTGNKTFYIEMSSMMRSSDVKGRSNIDMQRHSLIQNYT